MFMHVRLSVSRTSSYIWLSSVCVWVGGGAGTDGIALEDESFGGVRKDWNPFRKVAVGDVVFGGM